MNKTLARALAEKQAKYMLHFSRKRGHCDTYALRSPANAPK